MAGLRGAGRRRGGKSIGALARGERKRAATLVSLSRLPLHAPASSAPRIITSPCHLPPQSTLRRIAFPLPPRPNYDCSNARSVPAFALPRDPPPPTSDSAPQKRSKGEGEGGFVSAQVQAGEANGVDENEVDTAPLPSPLASLLEGARATGDPGSIDCKERRHSTPAIPHPPSPPGPSQLSVPPPVTPCQRAQ